jgi:hypothetical protein
MDALLSAAARKKMSCCPNVDVKKWSTLLLGGEIEDCHTREMPLKGNGQRKIVYASFFAHYLLWM